MTEAQIYREKPFSYKEFQGRAIQSELRRFPLLKQWVNESIAQLPEMGVMQAPLTNDKWKAEHVEGEVDKIKGAFFTVEGVHVSTPAFSWDQPSIQQAIGAIEIPTSEGLVKADVSGIVGIIQDTKGNVLVTMAQEPLTDTPKHALVRTPLQTSAAKFADLMNGDMKKDPAFVNLLETLFGEGGLDMFKTYLATGEAKVWPLASPDANRLHSVNIGIGLTLSDEEKQQALVADGKNRWVSKDEVQALNASGLLNGHTAVAIAALS